ncbi:MAG TPA: LLM class flavin-dependent oxidoreductase [Gemmatimonadaceae bacterium]|nr:LLM class flavin-dependent oxidoreductase [Gemmatimonadaceae bacterium]
MKFGFVLPGGSATEQLDQATLAENAGWDGVFVWEGAYGVDAWALLSAMAMRTSTIALGTMLTPLPWRRPWKVASQAATLDELSDGRAILAVGLGWADSGIGDRRDATDRAARARLLDEGLDVIDALWRGELQHHGPRYELDITPGHVLDAAPTRPRVPIWVVGAWPRPKSMRRVLRCDGILPVVSVPGGDSPLSTTDVRDIAVWLAEHGKHSHEIVVEGATSSRDAPSARAAVTPWAEAGATWWLDARWKLPHHSDERMQQVRRRLQAGPPSL